MNRSLAYFSMLLIIVGVAFGYYLISFLGALLLIPSLLSPSRPPVPQQSTPQKQEPWRITSHETPQFSPAKVAGPQAMAIPMTEQPQPTPMQTYSSPLFPMPMFPSLNQTPSPSQTPTAERERADELVEVAAIVVLLKFVFG